VPRIFTQAQAERFLGPRYQAFWSLRSGIDGGYNDLLFELAQMADHFVPAFFSPESALAWLLDACRHNGMLGWPGEDPRGRSGARGASTRPTGARPGRPSRWG
jgi:hypothetical protein